MLRTQANVLARTSVFVVSKENGELNHQHLLDLLPVFFTSLKDKATDAIVFARLLTLLEALWQNFDASFENKFSFTKAAGLNDQDMWYILERMDSLYLNKEEENIVGKVFKSTVKITLVLIILFNR